LFYFVTYAGMEPVDAVADLDGLKVAGSSSTLAAYEAAFGDRGYFPIAMAFAEFGVALQTAVVDAVLLDEAGFASFRSAFDTAQFVFTAQRSSGTFYDLSFGTEGRDRLSGTAANDEIEAGAGNDRVTGGRGRDDLLGQGGDDTLKGGNGQDRLFGGAGSDVLNGGNGRDILSGGRGADVFVFVPGSSGVDLIRDFEEARDTIALRGVAEGDVTAEVIRGNTLISVGDSAIVRLQDVVLSVEDITFDFS
jgi:hypothetical protein